ncbi:SPARC-related modular calcium-binding protein 1-like [Lepisosteus oculatus]|uniref:SPARC-related modular calcium-binding protein 1-like n=1 Tax=Lepisosteus oculatus TaxID=7918 RepID=UPI003710394F
MRALTCGCRLALLALLARAAVWAQTADRSPVLISESVWPRGCVLDCTKGRHRSVCGSDGRLYKSLCTFQRAHCINTELRIAPRAHCADPAQSKCQQARAQALDSSSRSDAGGVFVPECTEEGTFLQVQCHSQTGYCWCSTPDGKPVSGTSVLHQRPNCTGSYPERPSSPERDSAQREEGSRLRPTPESNSAPSLPAEEITAPPFWVTILLNSDPRGNRSAKRPTDTHLSCERERIQVLDQARVLGRDDLFVPECRSDGRFSPVQCHRATGYCWCVRAETGRPLPGTSTRNRLPDCSAAESARSGLSDRDYRDRALPGCPGPKKRAFLHQLLQALLQEARQTSGSLLLPSPVSVSPAPSSPPAAVPAPVPGALEVSDAELALRRYFAQLDEDGSGALSEREARPLQQYVRRKVRPRRCGRKLAQYCDIDDDRALTLAELTACLALARSPKQQ